MTTAPTEIEQRLRSLLDQGVILPSEARPLPPVQREPGTGTTATADDEQRLRALLDNPIAMLPQNAGPGGHERYFSNEGPVGFEFNPEYPRPQFAPEPQPPQQFPGIGTMAEIGASAAGSVAHSFQNLENLPPTLMAGVLSGAVGPVIPGMRMGTGAGSVPGLYDAAKRVEDITPDPATAAIRGVKESLVGDPSLQEYERQIAERSGMANRLIGGTVAMPAMAVDPTTWLAALAAGPATKAIMGSPPVRVAVAATERKLGPQIATMVEQIIGSGSGVGTFSGAQAAMEGRPPKEVLDATLTGTLMGAVMFGVPTGAFSAIAGKYGPLVTEAQTTARLGSLLDAMGRDFDHAVSGLTDAQYAKAVSAIRTSTAPKPIKSRFLDRMEKARAGREGVGVSGVEPENIVRPEREAPGPPGGVAPGTEPVPYRGPPETTAERYATAQAEQEAFQQGQAAAFARERLAGRSAPEDRGAVERFRKERFEGRSTPDQFYESGLEVGRAGEAMLDRPDKPSQAHAFVEGYQKGVEEFLSAGGTHREPRGPSSVQRAAGKPIQGPTGPPEQEARQGPPEPPVAGGQGKPRVEHPESAPTGAAPEEVGDQIQTTGPGQPESAQFVRTGKEVQPGPEETAYQVQTKEPDRPGAPRQKFLPMSEAVYATRSDARVLADRIKSIPGAFGLADGTKVRVVKFVHKPPEPSAKAAGPKPGPKPEPSRPKKPPRPKPGEKETEARKRESPPSSASKEAINEAVKPPEEGAPLSGKPVAEGDAAEFARQINRGPAAELPNHIRARVAKALTEITEHAFKAVDNHQITESEAGTEIRLQMEKYLRPGDPDAGLITQNPRSMARLATARNLGWISDIARRHVKKSYSESDESIPFEDWLERRAKGLVGESNEIPDANVRAGGDDPSTPTDIRTTVRAWHYGDKDWDKPRKIGIGGGEKSGVRSRTFFAKNPREAMERVLDEMGVEAAKPPPVIGPMKGRSKPSGKASTPVRAKNDQGMVRAIARGRGKYTIRFAIDSIAIQNDGKRIVATDGRALLIADKAKGGTWGKDGFYDGEAADKGNLKANPDEERKFPDYDTLVDIESSWKDLHKVSMDTVDLWRMAKRAALFPGYEGPRAVVIRNPAGDIGMVAGDVEVGSVEINVKDGAEALAQVNARALRDAAAFMYATGADRVELSIGTGPIGEVSESIYRLRSEGDTDIRATSILKGLTHDFEKGSKPENPYSGETAQRVRAEEKRAQAEADRIAAKEKAAELEQAKKDRRVARGRKVEFAAGDPRLRHSEAISWLRTFDSSDLVNAIAYARSTTNGMPGFEDIVGWELVRRALSKRATVKQLRAMLRNHHLSDRGTKSLLIAREILDEQKRGYGWQKGLKALALEIPGIRSKVPALPREALEAGGWKETTDLVEADLAGIWVSTAEERGTGEVEYAVEQGTENLWSRRPPGTTGTGGSTVGMPAPEAPKNTPTPGPSSHRLRSGLPKERQTPESVTADEIIRRLSAMVDTPIRVGHGRHKMRKAAGWFDPRRIVIRNQTAKDLMTAYHETGHALHKKFAGFAVRHGASKPYPADVARELVQLAKDLYGDRKPNSGYQREGWAEYVAHYMGGSDMAKSGVPDIADRAPLFHKWFQENVLGKNPDLAKQWARTKKAADVWRMQGAEGRIAAQIHRVQTGPISQINNAIEKLQFIFSRRMWTNDAQPLEAAVAKLMAKQGVKVGDLRPDQNPVVIRAALKMGAPGTAKAFIYEGTTDISFAHTGPPLNEALIPVKKSMDHFLAYAYARRAQDYFDKGMNPGISREDVEHVIKLYDGPEYNTAVNAITNWADRLMDYLVESGGLSKDDAKIIRLANPVYLPLKRYFDKEFLGGARGRGRRGVVNQPSAPKRRKGGGQGIVDPIEALAQQAEYIIALSNKIQVARAIVDLSDRFPGSAWFAEQIPTPKNPATISMGQVVDDVLKMLKEGGAEIELTPEQKAGEGLDDVLTVFTNATSYFGKDNIVVVWRKGKREFWHLDPDLYKVVVDMDREYLPSWLQAIMGPAKRAVQLGATALNPAFALARNPLRDVMTWNIYTKGGASTPFNAMHGLWLELRDHPDAVRLRASGGEMTTIMGQDRLATKRRVEEALATGAWEKGVVALKHPIDGLRQVMGVTEMMSRVEEYHRLLPIAEKKWGKGSRAASLEALLGSKEVTVPFTRGGIIGQALNGMIPFFNPAIQGASKFYRTFAAAPGRTAVRASAKALAWITAPSLLLWWLNRDEPWYQELEPWEKWGFWHFKAGDTIFRLPKPFELGYAFGSIPEAAIDSMYRKDPEMVTSALWEAFKQGLPITSVLDMAGAAFTPLVELETNYDSFRRLPIVPETELANKLPQDQYGRWTTQTAKAVGKLLGVSPRKVEHLMSAYSGGLLLNSLRAIENVRRSKSPETKAESERLKKIPVAGTLVARDPISGARAKSVNDLYDRRDHLRRLKGSGKATAVDVAALGVANRALVRISAIRKKVREGTVDPTDAGWAIVNIARRALGKPILERPDQ